MRHKHIGPYRDDSAYEEDLGSNRDIPKQHEFAACREMMSVLSHDIPFAGIEPPGGLPART